jgi:hypothetical protein
MGKLLLFLLIISSCATNKKYPELVEIDHNDEFDIYKEKYFQKYSKPWEKAAYKIDIVDDMTIDKKYIGPNYNARCYLINDDKTLVINNKDKFDEEYILELIKKCAISEEEQYDYI